MLRDRNIHAMDMYMPLYVLRNNKLKPHARYLYGYILMLSNKDGTCVIDTRFLAEEADANTSTLNRLIGSLEAEGLVRRMSALETANYIRRKNMNGRGIGISKCEWCGCRTVSTAAHHYPISKADGGTETVNICPNCHSEFHYATALVVPCIDDVKTCLRGNGLIA